MVFFKKEIDDKCNFTNELLEVKTINGTLFLYTEKTILPDKKIRESIIFYNKNDALLYCTKQYEKFEKERQFPSSNESIKTSPF